MPFADELLGPGALAGLIGCLERVERHRLKALRRVTLDGLALGERVRAVRDALLQDLPGTSADLHAVFRKALGDPRFTGWLIWPVTEAVALRACRSVLPDLASSDLASRVVASPDLASFDDGLRLLAELTPRLTAEFAIRTFLQTDLERSVAAALAWTSHPDEHVRRLASEGTRTRLPWARRVPALSADPSVTLPILDALHRDESEFVRRSVANHLNDLSRLDADLAVRTAERWLAAPAPTTARLVRHAMRTLVKQGHPEALRLMGFPDVTHLQVSPLVLDRSALTMGEDVELSFRLRHDGPESVHLAIDYVVHFVKANGSTSPKVFKLAVRDLPGGQDLAIVKRHSFRAITTRVHYPGRHRFELQINGRPSGSAELDLLS